MTTPRPSGADGLLRNKIALRILLASAIAITLLAVVAIWNKPGDAMTVFNITLPVFSSWVGTVLAFYFGRENFESASEKVESANQTVRELIGKLSPEERAGSPISSIMRKASETTAVKLDAGGGDGQVVLKDMRKLLSPEISRIPVLQAGGAPKYIVHGSAIDRYLADGGKDDDTLAQLIDKLGADGRFGPRRGFALVRPDDSIAQGKAKMEAVAGCLDIFVTGDGTAEQPLVGWVSNVRLGKYLRS
jgi:hypothetical protein